MVEMVEESEHLSDMLNVLLKMTCAVRDQAYYLQDRQGKYKETVARVLESLQRSVEVMVAAREGLGA